MEPILGKEDRGEGTKEESESAQPDAPDAHALVGASLLTVSVGSASRLKLPPCSDLTVSFMVCLCLCDVPVRGGRRCGREERLQAGDDAWALPLLVQFAEVELVGHLPPPLRHARPRQSAVPTHARRKKAKGDVRTGREMRTATHAERHRQTGRRKVASDLAWSVVQWWDVHAVAAVDFILPSSPHPSSTTGYNATTIMSSSSAASPPLSKSGNANGNGQSRPAHTGTRKKIDVSSDEDDVPLVSTAQ